MRLSLRSAGIAALALSVITCSEFVPSALHTGRTVGRFAMAPNFSPAAIRAYNAISAMGVTITNVHIVLYDLTGAVTLDTVVAFPANSDTLSVDLPVTIDGTDQQFTATIQLRDANGQVQFSSRTTVTAHDPNSSGPKPKPTLLTLEYVGPGHAAKTVTVSPSDANMSPLGTQDLVATAVDSAGRTVGDLLVTWTSSDTTIATVVPVGATSARVTAKIPRGPVTISATAASGAVGTAKLTVVPLPSVLVVISGAGQTGPAFTIYSGPFVVELRGTDGLPIANKLITFNALTAGGLTGEVQIAYVTTNSAGRASTTIKAGRAVGAYTFNATAGTVTSASISVNATNPIIGVEAQIVPLTKIPTSYSEITAASAQQFSAQLADSNGFYVQKQGVVITAKIDATPSGSTTVKHYTLSATSDVSGVLKLPPVPTDFPFSGVFTVTITSSSTTMLNACPVGSPPCLVTGTFTITP